MKLISVMNEKGGVGKTTISTTLGAGLARRGFRVLLLDADPQGNATMAMGIEPYSGFYDYMARDAGLETVAKQVHPNKFSLPDEDRPSGKLWIVGSNIETRHLSSDVEDMEDFLVKMTALDESNAIDIVIVDTAPTPSPLHTRIYLATDGVLYPTRLEAWSITGLGRSWKYRNTANKTRKGWGMPDMDVLGIIPIATELGTVEHAQNLDFLRDLYGVETVKRPIAKRIRWAECSAQRTTLYGFDTDRSQAYQDAENLVNMVHEYASEKTN